MSERRQLNTLPISIHDWWDALTRPTPRRPVDTDWAFLWQAMLRDANRPSSDTTAWSTISQRSPITTPNSRMAMTPTCPA